MVVGTGPGHPDYISPAALKVISAADILLGAQRLLDVFASPAQIQQPIHGNLPMLLDYIKAHRREKKLVVMVSGDTGLFSLADYLVKNLEPETLEFIPGISSIQYMFARIKRPWHNVRAISLHGRSQEHLAGLIPSDQTAALLTGHPWTVQGIARQLLKEGRPDCYVIVGKDLSYPQEMIVHTSLRSLTADENDYSNSVMVICNE
jgi:cobalt-precorrin-7 (C5)-methyltransferase